MSQPPPPGGLVFACIAPHGGMIVPELAAGDLEQAAVTRAAMEDLGRRMAAATPQTLVVITPHGVRVNGMICVGLTEHAFGELNDDDEQPRGHIELRLDVDRELGYEIAWAAAAQDIPVALAGYGSSSGESSCLPLDWGALIPLWFLGGRAHPPPQVVVITPSRQLPLQQLMDFGRCIAITAAAAGKRVGLIASSDLGHAHQRGGPYGYDPASARFDQLVVDAVRAQDLTRLAHLDAQFVEAAKPDGLWQILMLQGAIDHTPMRGELLSYQVPTYFGLLCAAYTPM
ncbi:MAG TPA: extradiol ring-cleavage dioxygenase [Chloroflexia bacterium]|nr:extradiol ring-cleavage dioxygenase [Chloroflexia bacterium]